MDRANVEPHRSFEELWKDATESFKTQLPKNKAMINYTSLDDMLEILQSRFNPQDPETGLKQRKVKTLVIDITTVVHVLGGIAAQGASMVFGPATLCFNAVDALLSIPQNILIVWDEIAKMFESVFGFLKSFKIYGRIEEYTQVNDELKESTQKLLRIFVDICIISIKKLDGSKFHHFVSNLKIGFLNDDGGLRESLQSFKILLDSQNHVSGALTLEHVIKSESLLQDINMRLEVMNKIQANTAFLVSKEQSSKLRDKLLHSLGVNDKERKRIEDSAPDLEVVKDTGSWLVEIDKYKSWLDYKSDAGPLLLISGDSGCGKTHLAFAIFNHTSNREIQTWADGAVIVTAFHRFEKPKAPSQHEDLQKALKAIVSQLISKSDLYTSKLRSHLDSQKDILKNASPEALCQNLLPPPNMRDGKDKVKFMLVLDDLNQLPENQRKDVPAILKVPPNTVKVVITGTPDVLETCFGKTRYSKYSIPVRNHNRPDIDTFIESRLDEREELSDSSNSGIEQIRNTFKAQVPEIVHGNFQQVQQLIEIISTAVKNREPGQNIMGRISEESLRDHTPIDDRLSKLSRALSEYEHGRLKELIIWVVGGKWWMTVKAMEAALHLQRDFLQRLEKDIEEKYSEVLRVRLEDQAVEFKNDAFGDYFYEGYSEDDSQSEYTTAAKPLISMNVSIQNAKMEQVQRFFWDLNEQLMFKKFDFDQQATFRGGTTHDLKVTKKEAACLLTNRCIQILSTEGLVQQLKEYGFRYLEVHMGELAQMGSTTMAEKSEIAGQLAEFLSSDETIQMNLTEEFFYELWWIRTDLDVFQRWLVDSLIPADTEGRARQWLERLHRKADQGDYTWLERQMAAMIGRHWLQDRKWSAIAVFTWIDAYVRSKTVEDIRDDEEEQATAQVQSDGQVQPITGGQDTLDSDKDEPNADSLREVPPVDNDDTADDDGEADSDETKITRCIQWAEKALKITKPSIWHERLGETYLGKGLSDPAKQSCIAATKFDDVGYETFSILAAAYAQSNDINAAVEEMEKANRRLQELTGQYHKAEDQRKLVDNLIMLAEWQLKLGRSADAISSLETAIKTDANNHLTCSVYLETLVQAEKNTEALETLLEWIRTPQENNLNKLEKVLAYAAETQRLHQTVFYATRRDDRSKYILQSLQNLKRFFDDKIDGREDIALYERRRSQISFHLAVTLARQGKTHNHDEIRQQWIDCYQQCEYSAAVDAAQMISNLYYSLIRENKMQQKEVNSDEHINEFIKDLKNPSKAEFDHRLCLGSLFMVSGNRQAAEQIFQVEMQRAYEWLLDTDTSNDHWSYEAMGQVLLHAGEDLDALTAWSMWGPGERFGKPRSYGIFCDGFCSKECSFADSLWFCKVCHDIQFCDECYEKLHRGDLIRLVCSLDHDWLRVPSWIDEMNMTGKDHVRMGGEMRNGQREGGEIVPVETWLDYIRKKWNIEITPRPSPEKQTEEPEQQDE